jgi:pimeloyl-ACP methyl ester carboxylesterase
MRFVKKLLIATLIALVFGVGLAYAAMALMPGFLFEWRLDRALIDAGADFETVEVEGQTFEYVAGGDGEAIVFVHGFGGDKRIWAPYLARLTNSHRVIALDLPGHGGSSVDPSQTFDVDAMADALGRFVDSSDGNLALPRFHLVGISMGGGVALAYAIENPDRVASLTLINPWGVSTPEPSDREVELERGHNVFFPDTLEELDELSTFVYGTPMPLDEPFKEHLLEQANARRPFNERVFEQMHAGPRLDERLDRLRVPTLVIVGGADRIVHPSSLQVYEARVPGLEGEMLAGCAHVFVGPCFDRAFARFEAFLRP